MGASGTAAAAGGIAPTRGVGATGSMGNPSADGERCVLTLCKPPVQASPPAPSAAMPIADATAAVPLADATAVAPNPS